MKTNLEKLNFCISELRKIKEALQRIDGIVNVSGIEHMVKDKIDMLDMGRADYGNGFLTDKELGNLYLSDNN